MHKQRLTSPDISSVLLLGSGALKIGEAGEFDYSGTQAIKALKEEGKRVILVNPNVATVQTSKGLADEIYFLPVLPAFVARVIAREKPDGILLSFGGQTALNCGLELARSGILDQYGVRVLGTPISAIQKTEDREMFARLITSLGMTVARGHIVTSVSEGLAAADSIGYPVMMRAGFALGGTGSGIARQKKDLERLLNIAFATTTQVIVEECLYGWKEVEYEVVRDGADNTITVCNMENMDPVGIHTGESIVVAPSQTLTNDEYFSLRTASCDVIRSLGIVGECNIQFALHPKRHDFRIIEVNARLSRSSALASKATGYPLAYVAAKLALGRNLPDLRNRVTGKTSAFFEPALDYVVVKIPRWDLDKFTHVTQTIGSEMKSVGEVMSIARTFPEALQKAVRMLNRGHLGVVQRETGEPGSKSAALHSLRAAGPTRLFLIAQALLRGATIAEVAGRTGIDPWFISELDTIVRTYRLLTACRGMPDRALMVRAKKDGFADADIAAVCGVTEVAVRKKRQRLHCVPAVKRIDTMAGEFPAQTNYLYCTYNADQDDFVPANETKTVVLGSGPYAIGTSVEFDWSAVRTVSALKTFGQKTVMINCNPETVSTDYDISDYLYFEELTLERVLDIHEREHAPMIVSVGGQIANNLAPKLTACGVRILGTAAEDIFRAESRDAFSRLLDSLGIDQPVWVRARTVSDAQKFAKRVGYPLLVRPSFVLSGKAMSVIESDQLLADYMRSLPLDIREYPLVMSKFITDAVECDFDGVAKNGDIVVSALSEHIEYGGVHSGDATMILPAQTVSKSQSARIAQVAAKIVKALKTSGPFNIQFLLSKDMPYVIECNLRASRSFPFVSKTGGVDFIKTAVQVFLGKRVAAKGQVSPGFIAVKAPQFSFHKLRGADPVLTVEMNSTGEVAAFGPSPQTAYLAAIMATGIAYPVKKAVYVSLGGARGKLSFIHAVQSLAGAGYELFASAGTGLFLRENGIPVKTIGKIYEGVHPNVVDLMRERRIDFAVVTPENPMEVKRGRFAKSITDGYRMRRMAVDLGIPIFTNVRTASFFIDSIVSCTPDSVPVLSVNDYHMERKHTS